MNSNQRREERRTYIECTRCGEQVSWNRPLLCGRCRSRTIERYEVGMNNDDGDRNREEQKEYENAIVNRINIINNSLNHHGFIDEVKQVDSMRIVAMNPNGFGPDSEEKVEMMCQKAKEMEIDIIMLSSPDRRWTKTRIERLRRKFQRVHKTVEILASDSGEKDESVNGWLPGGTVTIIIGRCAGMINNATIKTDKKGRWCAFNLEENERQIRIINLYRIPDNTKHGMMTSKAQYDRIDKKVKTAKVHREELLTEITDEITLWKSKGTQNFIVAGDFNQDVTKERICKFQRDNGIEEIHQEYHYRNDRVRDATHKSGKSQIDAVFASTEVIDCVQGSKLIDFNEIVITDHRGFMFDVNIMRYFRKKKDDYDESQNRNLNPNNRKHRSKFKKKLEEYIKDSKLEEKVMNMCNQRITPHEMNSIDDEITYALNLARKGVEGLRAGIPYSEEKQQKIAKMKYLHAIIRQKRGHKIDNGALERRKSIANISIEGKSIEEIKEMYEIAIQEWNTFKVDAKKKQEQKLMDLYPYDIADDTVENEKRRKKALKTVRQAQYRQNTFNILSKEVGKGQKNSLKRLYVQDLETQQYKQISDRNKIEKEIMKHNQNHFKQAFDSKAYIDRIYDKLKHDEVREKIIKGELNENECDYKEVYAFLELLKRGSSSAIRINTEEISEVEWKKVVTKAKRKSASSIFSQRTYSIYKCALDCDEMTRILLKFYNTIIKHRIYPNRWLKVLDIILEKGKGPILGKLRTIQLIEADFQLLMRVFIGSRNDENVAKEDRLSEFNYGSRHNYSIETAILEKRLMYDSSIRNGERTIHTISDLKACYDRQLPNIGSMVQESVGVRRDFAVLLQKVLPIMKHYVATDFGISPISYGNKLDPLGGTGQGNSASGAICRDTSCIIFKQLEKMQLGAQIKVPSDDRILQRVAIAFVDDTDFYANGEEYESNMQKIMENYTTLYEATGGQIQESKVMFYCWEWKYINGKQQITQQEAEIAVRDEKIKSIPINEATRTLGVHINPALSWKTQFEKMREKLNKSIIKFMCMDINPYQAAIYYNTYMIKSVYFGCGIVKLESNEIKELKRMYEGPILKKLGFSKNFPRNVLYSRKSALGIGLMDPNTIMDTLKLRLYLGNKRKKGNAYEALRAQEELLQVDAGRRVNKGENPKDRYWKVTWVDEVNDLLWIRKITIKNETKNHLFASTNKTIMEYALEYVKSINCDRDVIWNLNYVRMKKEIVFPFELLGLNGDRKTSCFQNIEEKGPVKWNIKKRLETKITNRQKEMWNGFKEWLKLKRIKTTYDFPDLRWKWKMTSDKRIIIIEDELGTTYYKKTDRDDVYRVCNAVNLETAFSYGIIGNRIRNEVIKICDQISTDLGIQNQNESEEEEFPEEMKRAIRNRRAVAATDASMYGNLMASHWVITTLEKEYEIEGGVESKKWMDGMIAGGEAIGVLDLIKYIVKKARNIDSGEIVVYMDNKLVIKNILKDVHKETDVTCEAGATIAEIKEEIAKASIEITVEYSNNKPKPGKTFAQQPGPVLMKRCDEASKEKRMALEHNECQRQIKYFGIETPCKDGVILDKNINGLLRDIDAKEYEMQSVKNIFLEKWEWVDIDARNCFMAGAGTGAIKCASGCNHHGKRNGKINNGLCLEKCPRCNENEDWEHVIKCEGIQNIKQDFITEITNETNKINTTTEEKQSIEMIINDIKRYILAETNEFDTTQHLIGMHMLFRGWVVKNWMDVTKETSIAMKKVNKILVKNSVNFYAKSWKQRNEIMHNPETYRVYVIEWYNKVCEMIEKGNKPDMRRYLETYKLEVEKCSNSYIRKWNIDATDMYKKANTEKLSDIRMFFNRV